MTRETNPPMIRSTLIAGAVALVALAGCATTEPAPNAAEAYKAPIYRTGSNLPAGRETGEPPAEMSAAERKGLEDLQNRPRRPAVKMN